MKLFCCAVRDAAVQAYGRPFFVQSRQVALRSFIDEVNRPAADNNINNHPSDFDLHALFELDDETGKVSNNQVELLARGKDVVQS